MDFTSTTYKELLIGLKRAAYIFTTFEGYLQGKHYDKQIILRHDVERHYGHALSMAKMQYDLDIKGTYFFRILPKHFKADIVKQIADMGHEVAYHYDDLTACKGDKNKAIERFLKHLEMLRAIAPVSTICMDGSPRSPYDNKDLWKVADYRDYGIIGEPYFDMDFNDFFYLTETGRRWDGWRVSVRDKVPQQSKWNAMGWVYRTTNDIIEAAGAGTLPAHIMMTFHPQRWHAKPLSWLKELVLQKAKNTIKYMMVKRQGS